MTIRGVSYQFVGDSFEKYRTPRTNSDGFYELDWAEINSGNLESFVKAFVHDAITHGANLDLSDSARNRLVFADLPEGIGGTSSGSQQPGYRIIIGRHVWNVDLPRFYSNNRLIIERTKLIYHELGHALLHAGHICDVQVGIGAPSYYAVMATGTCAGENGGPGYSFQETHGYNLSTIEGLIDHLFETLILLPNSQAAKGPRIIYN